MRFPLLIVPFLLISYSPLIENKSTKTGIKMQEFVINISKYARSFNPNFIIIPQNGAELAFNKLNSNAGFNKDYIDAIDGIGIEDLFYNGKPKTDLYRLKLLQKLKSKIKVIVSDFLGETGSLEANNKEILKEGFIGFPRMSDNEHYQIIPTIIEHENSNNITKLSEAQNFLYLINSSKFKKKAAFIKAISDTNFDVVSIDLFFDDVPFTSDEINQMKTKSNGGKRLVISYMNIGAAENWRYYWNGNWVLNDPIWLKKNYENYKNEIYVQFWHPEWQKIIYSSEDSYLRKIINAGFDGAYLDNVEAYYFLHHK